MKFNLIIILVSSLSFGCGFSRNKTKLIVYPVYCGGCVIDNFAIINQQGLNSTFDVFFDTTNVFIVNEAKKNRLHYYHLAENDIYEKFGDYANVVVINKNGKPIELKTNERLEKGIHY